MATEVLTFNFVGKDTSAGKTFDGIGRKTTELQGKLSRFSGFAVTALKGTAVALTGVGVAGVTMGIKTAAAMEQAQIGFSTLLGSGKEAQKFLAGLSKFAAATPFELPGLIQSSRLLIGVGVDTEDTMKILKSFGDAASAVGVGQENFQRIMLATSQTIDAGRFMTQDLNQITENGIPIWTELAKATGKPIPELRELASQGKLLSKDVLPILETQMNKDYGGAMAKQSKTLNGLWSTFMDTLNLGLGQAIQPLIPALDQGLAGATKIAGAALKGLPGVLTTVFGKLGDLKDVVTKDVIPAIRTSIGNIGKNLPDIDLSGIGAKFKSEAQHWGGNLVSGITVGIQTGDWSGLGKTAGNLIATAILGAANMGGKIAGAVGKWVASIDWLGVGKNVGRVAAPFAIGFVNTLFDGFFDTVRQHPLDVLMFVATFIPLGKLASAFKPLRNMIERLPLGKWIIGAIDHTAVPVFDAGKRFVGFIFKGIGEGFGFVFPEASGFVTRLTRDVGTEIGGRALYLADRAEAFIHGISVGIGKKAGEVAFTIKQVIGWVVEPFGGAGKWLIKKGRDLILGEIRGMKMVSNLLQNAITNSISMVTTPFVNAGRWLTSAGGHIIGGLKDGIVGAIRGIGSWLKGHVVDPIVSGVKHFFGIHSPSTVFAGIGGHLVSGLVQGMIGANPGAIVGKIFGSMPKALSAIVNKGLISITKLPKKALDALASVGGFVFGGSSTGNRPSSQNARIGQAMAAQYGWNGGAQWNALNAVVMRESGWRNTAQNPTSTAYGIFQFLDSTWRSVGYSKTSDPGTQIAAGLKYIASRYGSPLGALAHEQQYGWYGTGGLVRRPSVIGVAERGPERVLSASQTRSFERLVQVISRPPVQVNTGPSSPDMDYSKLGDAVARSMIKAGFQVMLDGHAVGRLQGRRANLLGRGG